MDDFCLRLVNVGAVQRLAKNNDLRFNLNLILDNRFKQYSGDIFRNSYRGFIVSLSHTQSKMVKIIPLQKYSKFRLLDWYSSVAQLGKD